MKRHMKRAMGLALMLIAPAVAFGSQAGPVLYPVNGIFYDHAAQDAHAQHLNPDFLAAMNNHPEEIGRFPLLFKQTFPGYTAQVDNANKYRTFAVSVQVLRASRYEVNKPSGTTDLFLPVTISLYFTNALTGEVLYSVSKTNYSVLTVVSSALAYDSTRVAIQAAYLKNFDTLLAQVLQSAKETFHPFAISAHILAKREGAYILDKGMDHGIAAGDELLDAAQDSLKVIYAGKRYAVAKPLLGEPRREAVFSKYASMTAGDIKKPRVLVLVSEAPDVFPGSTVNQLFSDNIGSNAAFTVLPVDPNFAAVLDTFSRDTRVSQKTVHSRELPDFFIQLRVIDPIYYAEPTTVSYKSFRTYQALAFGELVDQSGRVLYAAAGNDTIKDTVTGNTTFDQTARREIAVKNALLNLAQQFAQHVRFRRLQMPVEAVNQDMLSVIDRDGALMPAAPIHLYRSLGRIDGLSEDVVIPTWSLKLVGMNNGQATIKAVLPDYDGAPKPAAGDRVMLDSIHSPPVATTRNYSVCGPADRIGTRTIPGFDAIAHYELAHHLNAPLYENDFASQVQALVQGGTGFRASAQLSLPAGFSACIEPAYKVVLGEKACTAQTGICVQKLQVLDGFRVKQAGQVIARQGQVQSLALGEAPGFEDAMVNAGLIDRSMHLLAAAAQKLNEGGR